MRCSRHRKLPGNIESVSIHSALFKMNNILWMIFIFDEKPTRYARHGHRETVESFTYFENSATDKGPNRKENDSVGGRKP